MKHQRHSVIRELIDRSPVASQDDLRTKLAARGLHVTQATLSRDVRELRLLKGPTGYANGIQTTEDLNDGPGIREVLRNFALEARLAKNLLVVITATGCAQPVAAGLDYKAWPEVVGTIAGDDTVLIVCTTDKQATKLKSRIEAYFI